MGSPLSHRVKNAEQKMEVPWLTTPRKFKRVHSAGKVVALIFWDSQGVIMIDYLKQGRKIYCANYAAKFGRLHQEIARKRRGKLTRGILLLNDNAPAHTLLAQTLCTEHLSV